MKSYKAKNNAYSLCLSSSKYIINYYKPPVWHMQNGLLVLDGDYIAIRKLSTLSRAYLSR